LTMYYVVIVKRINSFIHSYLNSAISDLFVIYTPRSWICILLELEQCTRKLYTRSA